MSPASSPAARGPRPAALIIDARQIIYETIALMFPPSNAPAPGPAPRPRRWPGRRRLPPRQKGAAPLVRRSYHLAYVPTLRPPPHGPAPGPAPAAAPPARHTRHIRDPPLDAPGQHPVSLHRGMQRVFHQAPVNPLKEEPDTGRFMVKVAMHHI